MRLIGKFLAWVIGIPCAVLLVVVTISNSHWVNFSLIPFEYGEMLTYQLPLFIIVLGAILIGMATGGIVSWFSNYKYRKKNRAIRKEVEHLRKELRQRQQLLENSKCSLPST